MTLNIDLEDSYRIGFIGIDDYKAGTCLAGLAHNLTRSGENILILSGSKTIHSQSQRVNGFLDTMKQYPEILLINVIYTEDKLEISNKLLKDKGEFYMVHRPERLVDILSYMRQYKIEPKEIRFVCSHNNEMPKLVLIKGVKNAKPFLKIDKPLYIYDKNGNYTEEILKIYNKK